MPPGNPSLRRGRIVFAAVRDRNGHLKQRPCLILTPTHEIQPDEPLVVMAITTTYKDPPPEGFIELPWHPRGHPATGLTRRSAAVVGWYEEVGVSDVLGFGGDVPSQTMLTILARVAEQDGPS